jgi:outer membrane OprD family porin
MQHGNVMKRNPVSSLLVISASTVFWWFLITALTLLLTYGTIVSRVNAQEVINQEEPTPSSVDQSVTPIERSFAEKLRRPGFFPWLKDQLKDLPPFFRDSTLDFNLRNFSFDRQKFGPARTEAWAMGGALGYKSGWLFDRIQIGTTFYWSGRLWGPKDKDGTLLLEPGQHGYQVLGQLFGRIKVFDENFVNLYRYEYNTPFIGKNDNRMTPNTFEGYTYTGAIGGKDGAPGFRYGTGYITKIKERNDDEFVWMSKDAGAHVKRGVGTLGGLFTWGKFSLGAINYYSKDIINIFYSEGKYSFPITNEIGVLVAGQFVDQRSTGDNLLKGHSFDTQQFGLKAEASYRGAILTMGYTNASGGADLQSPWSGYPGYTSVQVEDFNRAGEQAFLAKLSYDLTRCGLEGVTTYLLDVYGWSRRSGANENELNYDLQWRPKWKALDGFSARFRYAWDHQHDGSKDNQHDFRVILNYDLSLM